MKNIGIICEYNPLHNGHARQLAAVNARGGSVCLMSGNYVQRGEPALLDKMVRAEAAILAGADLVLELPVTYALRSAEGFADGGVEIFDRLGFVDGLCFGSETGTSESLLETARLLLTEEFSRHLRGALDLGVSFPRARQKALEAMGAKATLVEQPNDILAVEYCKAILRRDSHLMPLVLRREGSYHESLDQSQPSASALRKREDWTGLVPEASRCVMEAAPRHRIAAGERAWLARLRWMESGDFEALPYSGEGLWRKVARACRVETCLEDIVQAAKSKRYTRTRLMRLLLCAFLGLTAEDLTREAPYVRVLAMNQRGQAMLRQGKRTTRIPIIHAGERAPEPTYAALERRAEDLYGLFAETEILPPRRKMADCVYRKVEK